MQVGRRMVMLVENHHTLVSTFKTELLCIIPNKVQATSQVHMTIDSNHRYKQSEVKDNL